MLDRNERLITFLDIITVIEGFALSSIGATPVNDHTISQSLVAIYSVLFSFIGYCMYKLSAYSKRLKAKKKL